MSVDRARIREWLRESSRYERSRSVPNKRTIPLPNTADASIAHKKPPSVKHSDTLSPAPVVKQLDIEHPNIHKPPSDATYQEQTDFFVGLKNVVHHANLTIIATKDICSSLISLDVQGHGEKAQDRPDPVMTFVQCAENRKARRARVTT